MPLPTLPTKSMFDLYMREKADMDDALNPFPTFKVWKDVYLKERQQEMDDVCIGNIDEEVDTMYNGSDIISDDLLPPENKMATKMHNKATKTKPLTNMDKARTIYAELFKRDNTIPTRKETMSTFMVSLKISKACASTYEYNIKQKYT